MEVDVMTLPTPKLKQEIERLYKEEYEGSSLYSEINSALHNITEALEKLRGFVSPSGQFHIHPKGDVILWSDTKERIGSKEDYSK